MTLAPLRPNWEAVHTTKRIIIITTVGITSSTLPLECIMPALGHKQTFRTAIIMSALPPKADLGRGEHYVRWLTADFLLGFVLRKKSAVKGSRAGSG